MNISQVKIGGVYAFIKDHFPGMSCAHSLKTARPVRIVEKVKMPDIKLDSCGRRTVAHKTMFEVEYFDMAPLHMYADDLDVAKKDKGIKVEERFIVARDIVCDWGDEVYRAREMAQLAAITEKYSDYLKGLMFFGVRSFSQLPEIHDIEGKLEISFDDHSGDFLRMIRATDAEWYKLRDEYYHNQGLPEIGFKVVVYRESEGNAIQMSDVRHNYGWHDGTGTSWRFNITLPLTQLFCDHFDMRLCKPPVKETKKGKISAAYKKWCESAEDLKRDLYKRIQEMPWQERHELGTKALYKLTSHVLTTLPHYVKDKYDGLPVKTTRRIISFTGANTTDVSYSEWQEAELKLLREWAAECKAGLPSYYTEEGE